MDKYPQFKQYMETHWLPLKAWWVYYERNSFVNLGNNTNNRVESQFGKLKQVVTRKRRLNECIRLLLAVIQSADIQDRYRHYTSRYKVACRQGYSGEGAEYFSIYAARKILHQLSRADGNMYSATEQDDIHVVTNTNSHAQYTVSDEATACTCAFNKTMMLPCRHVFVVRKQLAVSVVSASLMSSRWHLESSDSHAVQSTASSIQILGMPCPTSARLLSKAKKYTTACRQLNDIASIMSEVGMQEFLSMTTLLARVKSRFEAHKDCILLEDDEEDDVEDDTVTDGTGQAQPPTDVYVHF